MRRKDKRPSTQQDVSTTTRSTKRGRAQSSAQERSSTAAEQQPDLPDQQQQLELQVPLYMAAVQHEHQAAWAAAGELSAENFSSSDEGVDAAALAATAVPTIHLQQQQQLLEEKHWVASEMAEQVQCTPLMRTMTAVSGTGLPAAQAEQQQLLSARMHPAGAAAHSFQAARAADELKSAAAMRSQLACLQQQCQQLAVQLHAQKSTMHAASAAAAAPQTNVLLSSSSASSTMLAPYALQTTPVVLPEPQHHQGVCSPESSLSGATAVTAVQHHELVNMVVAHLEDSSASEEAQRLEALLEHELLAAAAAQPADAQRYSWALRLNHVIDSFCRAISSAATASAAASSCSQHSYPPAAAEHASAGMPAAQLLPAAGMSHVLQGARHCAQAPAAAPASVVDMRLATLQHQMVNLQGMIGMLKSQVGM